MFHWVATSSELSTLEVQVKCKAPDPTWGGRFRVGPAVSGSAAVPCPTSAEVLHRAGGAPRQCGGARTIDSDLTPPCRCFLAQPDGFGSGCTRAVRQSRSEEHTSELQS